MANRIQYDRVVAQANSIKDLANDLNREITNAENLLDCIKREWKGPASDAFQQQLLMLIADMKATKYDMSSVSTTIKNTAARIQEEDEAQADPVADIVNDVADAATDLSRNIIDIFKGW